MTLGSSARGQARQSPRGCAVTIVGRIGGRRPIQGAGRRVGGPEPLDSTHVNHWTANRPIPEADAQHRGAPAASRPMRSTLATSCSLECGRSPSRSHSRATGWPCEERGSGTPLAGLPVAVP